MALRDITLGQYFPGSSPIHRLDPRAKLLAMICYIVALFLGEWFATYSCTANVQLARTGCVLFAAFL